MNVPSDDPLAAAQMVGNQAQSNRADQYLQNIDTLTSQLQTADTALGSAVTAVTQAITLGVQGSTGTLSDANRQQIVQNLQGIQSQLVQLANTVRRWQLPVRRHRQHGSSIYARPHKSVGCHL